MIDTRILDYVEKRLEELGNRFRGQRMTTDQFLRLERMVDDFRITYGSCASAPAPRAPKPRDPNDPYDRAMRGI